MALNLEETANLEHIADTERDPKGHNIIGTEENDVLVSNYSNESTWMIGRDGNDTYVVEDIAKSWSIIADGNILYDTDIENTDEAYYKAYYDVEQRDANTQNPGNDKLLIKNVSNPNNLMFFFDVAAGDNKPCSDGSLVIINKAGLTSVMNQLEKDALINHGVEIQCYFDNNNDLRESGEYSGKFGANYIKTIQTMDNKGYVTTVNLDSYINTVRDKVKTFLVENNKTSALFDVLLGNNATLRNKLLDIYKNAQFNYSTQYEGGLVVSKEAGETIIDLTGVERIYSFTGSYSDDNTAYMIDGEHGPQLRVDKEGNNLVILYNGVQNDHFGIDDDWEEYKNFKKYVIPNYFKTKNGIDGLQVKAYVAKWQPNGEIIPSEEPQIFDLKDVATVGIGYEERERGLKINGTIINDDIDGSKGNDVIYSNGGNDFIYGNGGNDTIYGGDGNDVIYGDFNASRESEELGKPGNDKLYGGAGKNELRFRENSGHDMVYSTKGAEDTLVFEEIEDARGLAFDVDSKGNNLIIKYGNDSVTVVDYMKNPAAHSVQNVKFSNGASYSLYELIYANPASVNGSDSAETLRGGFFADIITGKKGNDKLYGGKGVNTFVFKGGDGNDTIYYEGGEDIIDLTGVENLYIDSAVNGTPCLDGIKQGNDLIIQYSDSSNDTIRLANYFKTGQNLI